MCNLTVLTVYVVSLPAEVQSVVVQSAETRKTLVALATVSRYFQEEAERAIWRKIPGITPLVYLLCPLAWTRNDKHIAAEACTALFPSESRENP